MQRQVMPGDLEPCRRQAPDVAWAGVDWIDPVAVLAVKVVMVVAGLCRMHVVAQGFETCWLAGQFYLDDLLLVLQRLDLAVHRGQIQARRFGLRPGQDLVRAQRLAALFERVGDGLSLVGVTFHDPDVNASQFAIVALDGFPGVKWQVSSGSA